MKGRSKPLRKRLFGLLGPGLLTGAADDDPSGIATYSQSGAELGYALCWTMFLTTPFMVAVQIVSARIGSVTGRGLAANLKETLPPALLFAIVALLAAANIFNIAADVAAMGEAARLLVGGPALVYALVLGVACLMAQIVIPYRPYARYMKLLTLVLFAYVAASFSVHVPWNAVIASTFVPRVSTKHDFVVMLVAVLGTTISPYLFFWQASLEVEERRLAEHRKEGPLGDGSRAVRRTLKPIAVDTWTGMVLSNVVGFFIIVTTAATLHAHGIDRIGTAADAARALRPLAGRFAFLLFSLGIIGTGLLAIPALAGSVAYAVAETFDWKDSLGLRPSRARGFYAVVAAATLIGSLGALSPIDPITMLVWSAVVNGIVAVPLMTAMMAVVTNRSIMKRFVASRLLTMFGWCATLLMGAVVAALLWTAA